ncbi:MAG: hypothetical protein K6F68_03835 [Clostridiales bacterium]|nr:hypothetical protein [Clostridiales bacterium]
MKKLIAILLAAVFILSLTGCSKLGRIIDILRETEAPDYTDVPGTEAPDNTPEPTEAPEVTEEPVPETFLVMLEPGVPVAVDLDEDGKTDTVLLTGRAIDEWDDYEFTLTITLGANSGDPYKYVVDYCFECNACIIDCYPDDGRKEVLISSAAASEDWDTVAFRVIDGSTQIDDFHEYFGVTREEMLGFSAVDGFEIRDYTDVLGTRLLHARMKVTSRGYFMVSEDYSYVLDSSAPADDEYWTILLTAPLDGTMVKPDGTAGDAFTIPAGTRIRPYKTNLDDYVSVLLPDGTVVKIRLEIHSWSDYGSDWGIFLNGKNQDEYAEMFYAG